MDHHHHHHHEQSTHEQHDGIDQQNDSGETEHHIHVVDEHEVHHHHLQVENDEDNMQEHEKTRYLHQKESSKHFPQNVHGHHHHEFLLHEPPHDFHEEIDHSLTQHHHNLHNGEDIETHEHPYDHHHHHASLENESPQDFPGEIDHNLTQHHLNHHHLHHELEKDIENHEKTKYLHQKEPSKNFSQIQKSIRGHQHEHLEHIPPNDFDTGIEYNSLEHHKHHQGNQEHHHNHQISSWLPPVSSEEELDEWKPLSKPDTNIKKSHTVVAPTNKSEYKKSRFTIGQPEIVTEQQAMKELELDLRRQPSSLKQKEFVADDDDDTVYTCKLGCLNCVCPSKRCHCPCCNGKCFHKIIACCKLCKQKDIKISENLRDPNTRAWLYFKILSLKSFQLFVATVVTFYFQLSWKSKNDVAFKPSLMVQFAITNFWSVFIALACYIVLRIDIRCQKQKVFLTSFIVYFFQTVNITYVCFICGLVWDLIHAPVVTMTLCLVYLILALIPFTVVNGAPSTKSRSSHLIASIFVLIFSSMSWLLLAGILYYYESKISLSYKNQDWIHIVFLQWFPAFIISEAFCMIDIYELRKIFEGQRISLTEKSWMFATVYL